jgi:hypothetical protein
VRRGCWTGTLSDCLGSSADLGGGDEPRQSERSAAGTKCDRSQLRVAGTSSRIPYPGPSSRFKVGAGGEVPHSQSPHAVPSPPEAVKQVGTFRFARGTLISGHFAFCPSSIAPEVWISPETTMTPGMLAMLAAVVAEVNAGIDLFCLETGECGDVACQVPLSRRRKEWTLPACASTPWRDAFGLAPTNRKRPGWGAGCVSGFSVTFQRAPRLESGPKLRTTPAGSRKATSPRACARKATRSSARPWLASK